MAELDVGILLRHGEHERVEIAEGGREDQPRPVELDHALHRFRDGIGLGHVLFLDDGHVGDRLERLGGNRVGLVPAEVVTRPDIDDADGERRRHGLPQRQDAAREAEGAERCTTLEELAARQVEIGHLHTPLRNQAIARKADNTASWRFCRNGHANMHAIWKRAAMRGFTRPGTLAWSPLLPANLPPGA